MLLERNVSGFGFGGGGFGLRPGLHFCLVDRVADVLICVGFGALYMSGAGSFTASFCSEFLLVCIVVLRTSYVTSGNGVGSFTALFRSEFLLVSRAGSLPLVHVVASRTSKLVMLYCAMMPKPLTQTT